MLLSPRFEIAKTASGSLLVELATSRAPPAAAGAASGSSAGVPTGPDGKPLSKSALKKLAKRKNKPRKEKVVYAKAGEGKRSKAKKAAAAAAAAGPKEEFVNPTPVGDKKDMTTAMLSDYQPRAVEAAWNDWWNNSGFYTCDPEEAKKARPEDKFIMVIPPPNVTGSLHLGHGLMASVEDALARWHRMRGKFVLWLPGTDHAGIATQSVVERQLMKNKGLTRHDLGREAFLKEVWAWKEQYGNRITSQLRTLGVSVDWSREAFTMDDNLSVAVKEGFYRMYEGNLITRANRLVNWSCALSTALSNIEVDTKEIAAFTKMAVPGHDPKKLYEFGVLTEFAYKVVDSDEELVVATTRLETMLGDTAVAVHPRDERYKHLHGRMLQHPFVDRQIPIITDGELVDMEFGTGAVKITPAHDPNDFKAGQRNNLKFINVLDDNGLLNSECGEFEGMRRFDAREAVEARMKDLGLYRGKKGNPMSIPLCSRSGDVIEPVLKPQWWVDCKSMAKRSVDAVHSGDLKIVPEFHKATWFRWLDDCHDWCISRQLWWGHRIPAWYATFKGEPARTEEDMERWIVARSEEDALATASAKFGKPPADIILEQDPDVLDTWFSSGLFPFSTFGWPDEGALDLSAFFPNTLLETGHDILFFWVARMVMMSLFLTDKLPFDTVYLHAMVRDKYGRKMSKALGNVVDPLEVIYGCSLESLQERIRNGNLPAKEVKKACEGQALDFPQGIPECGADALRFGLLAYTLQGRDINLDINRVVSYRHFCNKLWNATRFALAHFDGYTHDLPLDGLVASLTTGTAPRDQWILSLLATTVSNVTSAMENFMFAEACTELYNFWYRDLCNTYLELIKPVMQGTDDVAKLAARRTLLLCMELGLRLLHPFMPYVTEELWQRLPCRGHPDSATTPEPPSIMVAAWPGALPFESRTRVEQFALANGVINSLRSLRASFLITGKTKSSHVVTTSHLEAMSTFQADIASIAHAEPLILQTAAPDDVASLAAQLVDDATTVYMVLKGAAIDFTEVVRKAVRSEATTTKNIAALNKKMAAPKYAVKAPDSVRKADEESLAKLHVELESAVANRARMEALAASSGK